MSSRIWCWFALATTVGIVVLRPDALVAQPYGPTQTVLYQLTFAQLDKVLKGAKPSELPVVQPAEFELALNMRTAKALGLTVPPSMVSRADQVIH